MSTTWLMFACFNIFLISRGRRKDKFLSQRSENSYPSDRSVYGVCLRPLYCWDGEIESRRGMDICLLRTLCVVS